MSAFLALALAFFFAAPPDWESVPSPVHAGLRGLCVVSSRVVWASGTGGTVFHTSDAGAHWSVSVVPESASLDFRDVQAWDDGKAVIMSSGPGDKSSVFLTNDGGLHWHRTLLNPDEEGFFDAMAFSSPRHGFLVGDAVRGHFAWFETQDGGETWHRGVGPSALPGESLFAASGTCLVIRHSGTELWIATGGLAGARVLHSKDAGHTWSSASVFTTQGSQSSGLFSIAASSGGRLIAVGGNFKQPNSVSQTGIMSRDRGVIWSSLAGLGGYRSSVVFAQSDVQLIIAVGTNGSDVSTDGGHTWTRFSVLNLNSVAASADGSQIWAVGPEGRVARLRR